MKRQIKRALIPLSVAAVLSLTWQTLAQQNPPQAAQGATHPAERAPVARTLDELRLEDMQEPQATPSPTPLPTPVPTAAPWGQLTQKWIVPVPGAKDENPFGNSYQYFGVYRGGHTGVDLAAPVGTPVQAVADGKVVRIFTAPNMRYGLYVVLEHSPHLYSLYGHLSSFSVKLGQQVKQGQVFAKVGNSGAAGYPHLHIEALNRLPYFDGAWGYLYICYGKNEKFSFVNQSSFVISAITRQYGATPCGPHTMHEPVTYYNPEYLWSDGPPPMHLVAQPENDQWRRSHRQPAVTPNHGLPALTKPALTKPVAVPLIEPRAAQPDKARAPGEGARH